MVPRKAAKLQVKKITKTTFVIYSHKTGSSYNQNYFTEKCAQIGRLNEVVLILERETTLFFLQKKVQKVIAFFLESGEEIGPWFCNISIAQCK